MKLKVRKLNIAETAIFIFLLVEVRFFYLFTLGSISNLYSYKNKMILAIITLLLTLAVVTLRGKIRFNTVNKWIIVFVLYNLFEAVRNGISYSLSFNQIFLAFHGSVLLLLVFISNDKMDKQRQGKYLINLITIFSLILSTLFVLQAIAYNYLGISFLKIYEYTFLASAEIRSLGIRMTFPGTLIIFSVLISGACLHVYKNKMHIWNLVIGLVYVIYVSQTRVTTIMIGCTLILVWLFHKTGKSYIFIKRSIIVIMAIVVILAPLYISDMFDATTGSVYARTYSYTYYFTEFKNHLFLGIGLLPDDNTSSTISYILHGDLGYANLTDVGVFGYLVQYGIFGVILLIAFVWIFLRRLKNCKEKDQYYYICLSFFIYVVATCSTLSIFDVQRIVMLPIILMFLNLLESRKGGVRIN